MLKRFEVMDLFHGDKSFEVKEWIDPSKELPKEENGIYKVRLDNGNEIKAYYCSDRISWLARFTNDKLSHWWDKRTKEPLYNVTHWGKNEE
jgi:hypothetical protein